MIVTSEMQARLNAHRDLWISLRRRIVQYKGPSYRWRDGWALYHWHGVQVTEDWIMQKDTLTADAAWQHVTNRPGWRDYTLFQAAINIMEHRDGGNQTC